MQEPSVKCSNYANLGYEHHILESKSDMGKYFDRLGICGICRKLAFETNTSPTNPQPVRMGTYRDSKINPGSGPCGNDTL